MEIWIILSGIFGFACLIVGVIMCAMVSSSKISRREEMEEIFNDKEDSE